MKITSAAKAKTLFGRVLIALMMRYDTYLNDRVRLASRKRRCTYLALALVVAVSVGLAGWKSNLLRSLVPAWQTGPSQKPGAPETALHQPPADLESKKDSLTPAAGQFPADQSHSPTPTDKEFTQVVKKTVKSGQTLTGMLQEHLSLAEIYAISRECSPVFPVRKIKAGQPYSLCLNDRVLAGFEYEINSSEKLVVAIENGVYHISKKAIDYTVQRKVVSGSIETSMFEAVREAGEKPALAIALADIFAWDIDFIRDIRVGDSFNLIVEKRFRQDKFSGYGRVLASRFVNQGRVYHAFLYQKNGGRAEYFDASGQAVRKAFLKAPLHFTRISSGFSHRRKHPILKIVRPHLGIDYAAPQGTPIHTVADGTVTARGRGKAAGKYIKIHHHNGYVTIYNHMHRFASGTRKGNKVTQGMTIGYVGSTGLSTGPHLDFRVLKNGKHINPLKIDSTPLDPIPAEEMESFQTFMQPLLAVLEGDSSLYAQVGPMTTRPKN